MMWGHIGNVRGSKKFSFLGPLLIGDIFLVDIDLGGCIKILQL